MYAITHNGVAYGPCGKITDVEGTPLNPEDTDAYNKEVEKQELAWLRTHPEKVTLYVKHDGWQGVKGSRTWSHSGRITTWLGTVLDDHCWVGSPKHVGFGYSRRAAITAIIFGVKYHGWYFESSGQYCRLKKAKKQ